jgi:hypothetical protein
MQQLYTQSCLDVDSDLGASHTVDVGNVVMFRKTHCLHLQGRSEHDGRMFVYKINNSLCLINYAPRHNDL